MANLPERSPSVNPEAQYRNLLRQAPSPLRAVLFFLASTGARTQELCSARWGDYDREQGRIVLHQHKGSRNGGPRIIVLTGTVQRLLDVLNRRRQPGQDYIFVDGAGRAWQRRVIDRFLSSCRAVRGFLRFLFVLRTGGSGRPEGPPPR